MIRVSKTDDGWAYAIHDTGQTVRLNGDQLCRLYTALRRLLYHPDIKNKCRVKWKRIVGNSYSLRMDGHRIANVQSGPDGDDIFVQWQPSTGKTLLTVSVEEFVLCLRKEDRAKATEFFTSKVRHDKKK